MYTYSVKSAKIAKRNGTDDYETAVVIRGVQMMSAMVRVRSAEGFGDDELKVVASSKIGGSGQCRMLGVTLAALAVITGDEVAVSGADGSEIRTLGVDTGRLPHFGIIGQSEQRPGVDDEDAGEGDELLFLPNVVATSDITLGAFTDGEFQTVEFSYTGVRDGVYKVVNVIERATAGDYTLPPAHLAPAP